MLAFGQRGNKSWSHSVFCLYSDSDLPQFDEKLEENEDEMFYDVAEDLNIDGIAEASHPGYIWKWIQEKKPFCVQSLHLNLIHHEIFSNWFIMRDLIIN